MADGLEVDDDAPVVGAQGLTAAQAERYARPTLGVDPHRDLGERLGLLGRVDSVFGRVVGDPLAVGLAGGVPRPEAGLHRVVVPQLRRAEHVGHEVAQLERVEAGHVLHRHHRQDEQQVALDHVDERAGVVVVARTPLQSQGLVEDDVDALHVVGAPHGLEDPVREPEPEDVEHSAATEKVVDPVDLVFGGEAVELLVEAAGALEVTTERLLQRETHGRRDAGLLQHRAHLFGDGGREGEVDDAGHVSEFGDEFLHRRFVEQVDLAVERVGHRELGTAVGASPPQRDPLTRALQSSSLIGSTAAPRIRTLRCGSASSRVPRPGRRRREVRSPDAPRISRFTGPTFCCDMAPHWFRHCGRRLFPVAQVQHVALNVG